MTPVESAELVEVGVIVAVPSSLCGVRSPLTSRMAGISVVAAAPEQSLTWTLTGRTCPFLSLSVTGWLVIGGWKAPVPTLIVVDALSYPPSSSVTLTVADLQPDDANVWLTCCPVAKGDFVSVRGEPSWYVKAPVQLSAPGSVNFVVNVLETPPPPTKAFAPAR